MCNALEIIINFICHKELVLLYGHNSYVKVTNVILYRKYNQFIIHISLYNSDINLALETYPDGLFYLINKHWKFINSNNNIRILPTLK